MITEATGSFETSEYIHRAVRVTFHNAEMFLLPSEISSVHYLSREGSTGFTQ